MEHQIEDLKKMLELKTKQLEQAKEVRLDSFICYFITMFANKFHQQYDFNLLIFLQELAGGLIHLKWYSILSLISPQFSPTPTLLCFIHHPSFNSGLWQP